MSKYNYKEGGEVKISGTWYPLLQYGSSVSSHLRVNGMKVESIEPFIQDYREPKEEPKPYGWIDADSCLLDCCEETVNGWLTENYGDPTERVFNDEDVSEFGIACKDMVMYLKKNGRWGLSSYFGLDVGDLWRKLPPVLTK
jgi:hypothetical protein